MEDKTVWIAHGECHDIIAITTSDVEAARALIQTGYLGLDYDEGAGHEVECGKPAKYMSIRQAAKECGLDIETFLVKALRGQIRDYWIWDCSIEEYSIFPYPRPLE